MQTIQEYQEWIEYAHQEIEDLRYDPACFEDLQITRDNLDDLECALLIFMGIFERPLRPKRVVSQFESDFLQYFTHPS